MVKEFIHSKIIEWHIIKGMHMMGSTQWPHKKKSYTFDKPLMCITK